MTALIFLCCRRADAPLAVGIQMCVCADAPRHSPDDEVHRLIAVAAADVDVCRARRCDLQRAELRLDDTHRNLPSCCTSNTTGSNVRYHSFVSRLKNPA